MPAFNMSSLSSLSEAIEAAQKKAREDAKDAFATAFKSFFKAHPEVVSLSWRQYTPHFNDGDPCTFGVHEIYATLNGAEDQDDEMDAWALKNTEGVDRTLPADIEALQRIDEDLFEAAFGDHVKVTVTKDGIDVSDCSHD